MHHEQVLGLAFFALTMMAYLVFFAILSSLTFIPLILARYLKPYEAAKAVAV